MRLFLCVLASLIVCAPRPLMAQVYKEALQSGRTYYIGPNGIDSAARDGFTPGTAWRTLKHASDVAYHLDFNGQNVTWYLLDGYDGGGLEVIKTLGTTYGNLYIRPAPGNANPVTIAAGVYDCGCGVSIKVPQPGAISVVGEGMLKIDAAGALMALAPSLLTFSGVEIGAGVLHLAAHSGGRVRADGPYTVTGGAYAHLDAQKGGEIEIRDTTWTFQNTPTFSTAFAAVRSGGRLITYGMTTVGTVSGLKAYVDSYGVLETAGNPQALPGTGGPIVATNTDGALAGLVR